MWTGILFIPACLIFFFKTGPMAWNGVIAFVIPVFIFVIWVMGLTVPAWKSVQREARATEILDEPMVSAAAVGQGAPSSTSA